MDISGLGVGLCSWLLRLEVMAGLTVMVWALTLGSFTSLPLLMSKPWSWSLHQPVSSPLSPQGALHRLAGVTSGPLSAMDAAKHLLMYLCW